MTFTDPGEQPRGKSRMPDVRAPEPASLFDISGKAPDTPLQVTSSTSIDAAKKIRERTKSKRRDAVYGAILRAPQGLTRFQVAGVLKVPDHWCSSAVAALIAMGKVEESGRTAVNPKSGKACAVLVAIAAGDMEGAA